MWTLVLILSTGIAALTTNIKHIDGFKTEADCKLAARQIVSTLGSVRYECVYKG